MEKNMCCYINDNRIVNWIYRNIEKFFNKRMSCNKLAEWYLIDGYSPEDYSHSCSKHLSKMLSDKTFKIFKLE